jgi:hypothetical protein
MQKATNRTYTFIATLVAAIIMAMVVFFGLTVSAYGAEGTDGTPKVYCNYYDEDGKQYDGNKLKAGTYCVNFYTTGVDKISAIEITSTVDTSVVTIDSVDESNSTMTSMGYVADNENGNLVVGYVSSGDYAVVDEAEQFITSVKMTFAIDCDADDYVTVSDNPNLTFIVTDSADNNYDDEYALVDSYESYNGVLSLMTCDITPAFDSGTFDISGQIKIATDLTGTSTSVGVTGITVSVVDGDSTISSAVTDDDGQYTLTGIPAGEYKMLISGPTTIDREVTLVVSESKTVDSVGIVVCDYNNDAYVNATDMSFFSSSYSGTYNVYCDFNGDGLVNSTDMSVFSSFYNQTIIYNDVTLS